MVTTPEYYQKHKQQIAEYNHAYYTKHAAEVVKRVTSYRLTEKGKQTRKKENIKRHLRYPNSSTEWQKIQWERILNFFGRKCVRCGFDKVETLQIHHKYKKKSKRDFIAPKYDLTQVELLCANCHCIEHYKNKVYKEQK